MSTLFFNSNQHFFSVIISVHLFSSLNSAEINKRMMLTHLINSFLNHQCQKHDILICSSQDLLYFERTLWDLHINWFKIFADKVINTAAALILSLTLKNLSVYKVVLISVIYHYIWHIHEDIKHLSHYVSWLFYSVDSSCLFKKSFILI